MPDDAAIALVLLLFLSAAVERAVEVAVAPIEGWSSAAARRALAIGVSVAAGAAIAYGLQLDLAGALLGGDRLTSMQGRGVTAIALAGGSGPVNELVRLIEEAKRRSKAGSELEH